MAEHDESSIDRSFWRETQWQRLGDETFDVLVIGGGATGTGVAVDAATRGLRVALVEADDFASGTSSRSTKLIHGGVRYLEQAVVNLDRSQLDLVREALRERATMLKIAPHLTRRVQLIVPIYRWWRVPYYYFGLKVYDWLSGKRDLGPSTYMSRAKALQRFPGLRKRGLVGAVAYWDGQFDDARMNVALAMTAAEAGAVVLNHAGVVALQKREGRVTGATVHNELTGEEIAVTARVVINATGPLSDRIRRMDESGCASLVTASSGTHLFLPRRFAPRKGGVFFPKTADGRVMFLMRWKGGALAGTTDVATRVTRSPKPSDREIDFIVDQLNRYLEVPLRQQDIKAAWSGLRPLVASEGEANTANLVRGHHIDVSEGGLVTVVGGKWTTYRRMAEDTIDAAIALADLKPGRRCQTPRVRVVGAIDDVDKLREQLTTQWGFGDDIAKHLARDYGARADRVAAIADGGYGRRLTNGYPYIEADVIYAVDHEYACTIVDVLARRTRLAFLDEEAAEKALPVVAELMGQRLGWTAERHRQELADAKEYLERSEI